MTRTVLLFGFAAAIGGLAPAAAQVNTCGQTTWALTEGQNTPVGTVSVCNDATNLYITYTLTAPNATFGMLHVWAGSDIANVPANPQGIPVPGQFCNALGGRCYDATGRTTYTFAIPFNSLNIPDVKLVCGSTLYVVAHAEVGSETAFGGPIPGPGNRWWFYGSYSVCCDFGPPTPPVLKTAFAKGGWVFTTGKNSNPENLPSLGLTQNRWGWAINLRESAGLPVRFDLWADAGLNRTSAGTKVGFVVVVWDGGATAQVVYMTYPGFLLQEVHLYAGDARPTTVAPGQFGYLDSFEPTGVSWYGFKVPLSDTNGVDGVWLIAHAVVSSTAW